MISNSSFLSFMIETSNRESANNLDASVRYEQPQIEPKKDDDTEKYASAPPIDS